MPEKPLHDPADCGKISTSRWVICPRCKRQKLLRRQPDTEISHALVWCRYCHQEIELNIRPDIEPELKA